MADTFTTNLNLTKPEPGAAEDTWGISLNADLDALDGLFSATGTSVAMNLDGAVIDSSVIGGTTAAAGSFTTLSASTSITGTLATAAQPNITSLGTLTGLTTTGDINFGDNDKAIFGAGNDLQIYHDGSHSFVKDAGTGNLKILADNLLLQRADESQTYIQALTGGAVDLRHAGSAKLATTSTGIDVTGEVEADTAHFGTGTGTGTTVADEVVVSGTGSTGLTIHSPDANNATLAFGSVTDNDYAFVQGYYNAGSPFLRFSIQSSEIAKVTSTGIDVTGTATMDGLTVDGTVNSTQTFIADNATLGSLSLRISGTETGRLDNFNSALRLINFDPTSTLTIQSNGQISNKVVGSNPITFSTANTERMRIDSSGNVGIGTTSPSEKLDIVSAGSVNMRLNNTSNNISLIIGAQSSAARITAGSGDRLGLGAGNTPDILTIASGGNVGIGTTSPDTMLHLSDTLGNAVIRLERNDTGIVNGDQYGAIEFEGQDINTDASGVRASIRAKATASLGQTALTFSTASNTATESERMRIDSSGNVGIGTSSPSEKLTVEGDGTFKNTTDATGATLKVADNVNRAITITSPIAAGSAAGRIAVTGTSNSLEIGVRDYPTALKIEGGSGNALFSSSVTVSKTSSGNIMQVASLVNPVGVANTGVRLWMSGKNTTDRGTFIDAVAESTLNNHSLRFGTSASASFPVEAMRIDSSGNLLVGKTSSDFGATAGIELNGQYDVGYFTRSGDKPLVVNRLTSDGSITDFRKDGTTVGSITCASGRLAIGNGDTGIKLGDADNAVMPFNVATNANRDAAVDLGYHSVRWKDLYLSGSVNGGGTYRAGNTGTGNIILEGGQHIFRFGSGGSYAERARIDTSGNLLVGTTSSNYAVAGSQLGVGGNNYMTRSGANPLLLNRLSSDGDILSLMKDGSTVGSIGTVAGYLGIANGDTGLLFRAPYDDILPYSSTANSAIDDTIDLGDASFRFQDIYATNGTIQTSDRNEKQDIEALTDAETRVAVAAKGLLRKFRWQSAVEEKGDDARIHFGIIAQDLQDAFTAEGLDAGDYGMFISTTWTDDDGVEQTRLGVRYNELLAFIIAAI